MKYISGVDKYLHWVLLVRLIRCNNVSTNDAAGHDKKSEMQSILVPGIIQRDG